MVKDLLSLLFPHRCVGCGKRIGLAEPELCIRCESSLSATRYYNWEDNPVSQLFWGRTKVTSAFSAYHYRQAGVLQEALYSLKYYGNEMVGPYLGQLLAGEIKKTKYLKGVEAWVPVPLHYKKMQKRGFNQARLIAEGLGDVTELPVLTNHITRVKFTSSQTKKSTFNRSRNVERIFSVDEPLPFKNVGLVDDVITTGSTMVSLISTIHEKQPDLTLYPVSVGAAS